MKGEIEEIQRRAVYVYRRLAGTNDHLKEALRAARAAEDCAVGGNLEGAEKEIDLARRAIARVQVDAQEALHGEAGVPASALERRAPASAGWKWGPGKLRQKERQSEKAEVIQLEARELFDLRGKKLSSADVVEAMARQGCDSAYIGEYVADLLRATKDAGSINQRREVMKLVLLFLQQVEPKTIELGEEDLSQLSDEELRAYQTIAARIVASQREEPHNG